MRTGYEVARSMEKHHSPMKPVWSAIERSPEEGNRRKVATEVVERALKVVGPGHEAERSGSIYKNGIDIMPLRRHHLNLEQGASVRIIARSWGYRSGSRTWER